MSSTDESATIAYLRFVLGEVNMSPTALAKAAGISATTLTRPLNNPGHKFNLSATTIQKIAEASGISPAPFFENKNMASRQLAAIHDDKVFSRDKWGNDALKSSGVTFNGALVVGEVAFGKWSEPEVVIIEDNPPLLLRLSNYSARDCFAVRVADSHVREVAYLGDYLLCVLFSAYRHRLSASELVIVERRRDEGRLVEVTARRLTPVKNGFQLSTIGAEERYRSRITIPTLPGDDEIQVIGLVEYVVRSFSLT